MRVIVQRVKYASCEVEGNITGKCEKGFLVLWGATHGDTEEDAIYLAKKCTGLRIFEDEEEKMNVSIGDAGGTILAVPNFTLYGNSEKGFRPSFANAMEPNEASKLYNFFCDKCRENGIHTEKGIFGADMKVSLLNDGPVTLVIDSKK